MSPASPLRLSVVLCLGLPFALGACHSMRTQENLLGIISPYRVEIVQGNVVTREQAAAVKPGMNRSRVRDLLGSPLLADVFHGDRWDYVFTIRRPGTPPLESRVVARFDGDILRSLDSAGELPSENEFVSSIDTFKTARNAPPLQLSEDALKALPAPAIKPPTEIEPTGPVRDYPPLEPRS